MSLEISRSYSLMEQALNDRAIRQDLIASNIANVDTPYYKARDINFKDALIAKKEELFGEKSPQLQMAKTSNAQMDIQPLSLANKYTPSIVYREGQAGNDGNDVDIDKETSQLSQNSIGYNALIAAIKKDQQLYTDVIDASAKLS